VASAAKKPRLAVVALDAFERRLRRVRGCGADDGDGRPARRQTFGQGHAEHAGRPITTATFAAQIEQVGIAHGVQVNV